MQAWCLNCFVLTRSWSYVLPRSTNNTQATRESYSTVQIIMKKPGERKVSSSQSRKWELRLSLRKNACLNILEILQPKMNNFLIKKWYLFHISAQNIDCGYSLEPPRRGGSNEYKQSMFLSRNKKNNVYPCKSQFYYIKVGFKGVKII